MKLLNETNAALFLDVSKKTMQRLRQKSAIPFIRQTAGRIAFLESDLEAYVLARRVDKTSN